MLDQHVAVTIGQDVCNLPAPLRDAKTIVYRPWINIWWFICRHAWRYKTKQPREHRGRDQGFDVSTSQSVEVCVRKYLDNLQETGARARSTMATYRHMLKHLERNPIGKVPFRELDPKQVKEWMISPREAGKSPATIQKAYNVLHGAYTQAVERD